LPCLSPRPPISPPSPSAKHGRALRFLLPPWCVFDEPYRLGVLCLFHPALHSVRSFFACSVSFSLQCFPWRILAFPCPFQPRPRGRRGVPATSLPLPLFVVFVDTFIWLFFFFFFFSRCFFSIGTRILQFPPHSCLMTPSYRSCLDIFPSFVFLKPPPWTNLFSCVVFLLVRPPLVQALSRRFPGSLGIFSFFCCYDSLSLFVLPPALGPLFFLFCDSIPLFKAPFPFQRRFDFFSPPPFLVSPGRFQTDVLSIAEESYFGPPFRTFLFEQGELVHLPPFAP